MLNSLASYLLGYPGSSSPAAAASSPSPAVEGDATITVDVPSADSAALPGVDVRLSAVEADDDWLLVDRADDDCSEGSPSATAAVTVPAASAAARLTLAVSTTSYHWPESDDAAAGAGALAAAGPLEESWFVTPPPCFTSGSVPLETSPLENLLIEHPSMSVYHRSAAPVASATPLSSSVGAVGASPPARSPQRAGQASASALRRCHRPAGKQGGSKQAAVAAETSAPPRTASPSSAASPAVERGAAAASPTRSSSPNPTTAQTTTVQTSPRRPSAFSPYQQQQQQSVQYRTAQKLVQRAACQQLKRDSLERNNKAREIRSSRNKRQRRSDHMQHHSGANNNRKC